MTYQKAAIAEYLPGRRGVLLILFLVLVAVEVATVTAVVMSQRVRTEDALLLHDQRMLRGVVVGTRENALKFLTQAQNAVQLTANLVVSGLLSLERPWELERYFFSQLAIVPQMDGLYFADPNGLFLFTKRSSSESASKYETKIIDFPAGVRRVRKIWRDEHFKEIERKVLDGDSYDARVRPWYLKATTGPELIWSDPYIFFTSKVPGITAAARVMDSGDELVGIVGADVELGVISDFLAAEKVTAEGGGAVLVHKNGDVLAYPLRRKLQVREGEHFRLAHLDELDPIISLAAKTLRFEYADLATLKGSHFDSFRIDGKNIVMMFVPFSSEPQWPWLLGVYAPEENFSGTIRTAQRQALVLAIATSIVILLAALMFSPALIRALTALHERATRDPLSTLIKRRSFEELAARAFNQAKQADRTLAAIRLDIDHFKSVSERFGHDVWDEVVVAVAGRIQQALSATDLVTRYGGEEIAIVLPRANIEEATAIGERIRKAIESTAIGTSAGPVAVTISLGVAEYNSDCVTITDLMSIAEYRLLNAKRWGRKQVLADAKPESDV